MNEQMIDEIEDAFNSYESHLNSVAYNQKEFERQLDYMWADLKDDVIEIIKKYLTN